MLSVSNLSFSYGTNQSVLKDVSFKHHKGEVVSLLGPSGCGKSTLLRLVGELENSNEGISWLDGSSDNKAFVFQDAALLPWKDVRENVALPAELSGTAHNSLPVAEIIDKVGLAGLENRYPKTLSGGQKMRVSIARAIASDANYLLMDEPFAALDEILRFKMNDLLLELRSENRWSVLFVTHSIYEAAYISDRVLIMKDGRIASDIAVKLDRSLSPEEQRASPAFLETVSHISRELAE
jgi:NitT/TauT family transport system ATP-binding protein